jgi:O-antigen ligase
VVVVLAASRVGWVMGVSAVLLLMMSRYGAIVRILLGFVLAGIAIWLLYTVAVQGPGSFLDVTGNEWTTLNGRTDVWNVALQMFSMSPAIGWGFFLGPKHIGDILNQYWWHATNAQNDLLGAMVCGGYIGVLLFLIFIATLAVSFFRIKDGKDRALASGVFVLYLMSSSFEPFFVHSLGVSTVIMLLLIVQVSEWNRRSRAQSPASSGVPPQPLRPSRVP